MQSAEGVSRESFDSKETVLLLDRLEKNLFGPLTFKDGDDTCMLFIKREHTFKGNYLVQLRRKDKNGRKLGHQPDFYDSTWVIDENGLRITQIDDPSDAEDEFQWVLQKIEDLVPEKTLVGNYVRSMTMGHELDIEAGTKIKVLEIELTKDIRDALENTFEDIRRVFDQAGIELYRRLRIAKQYYGSKQKD